MTAANIIIWILKQVLDNISNDFRVWGRFLLTFSSVFMVTFFFFATMAKPLFKVQSPTIFKSHLSQWREQGTYRRERENDRDERQKTREKELKKGVVIII
jgi:hypothetical protein